MDSYHGMDSYNDEPASQGHHSVREKNDDREATKHTSPQGIIPEQSPRDKSPTEEGDLQDAGDFRHSPYFTNGVKDGSIVDTGIPRSKIQRQQLNDVFTAKTPITGVGCLESRSDNVVRRTEPLYKLAFADKVKLLLD
ncbi:hypothetical protein FOMG_07791 [Fusarium oxysporum f. sp. melonis 26406]|uniref:Uncharacterized protein n=1 Tax=Fusarium oxysporum f. sp. melonis 26406 TaxID=1089452 RepID=X0AUZ9_FUSOX|nr:hypothetical protein FOMG_07791 [Fusarium oxysporum f. sp. melonis 26406]